MQKAIVIGASEESVHAIEIAKSQGIYVIAVDGNPQALGMSYADKAVTADISDIQAVNKVVEEEKPDFVIPVPVGRFLDTMGYVNERYGLKGLGYEPIHASTDKFLFHQKLSKAGLRRSQILLLEAGSFDGVYQGTYPVIVKPRYGSGSRDVFYLQSQEELEKKVQELAQKQEDFLVEEMKEGTEFGIDAVVIEGTFHMLLLRKKTLTPLPARQATSYTSVSRESEIFQRVEAYMAKAVAIMEYDNCVMHADILVSDEESFVVEMSPRPSGHYLHNIFLPRAIGIDMLEEFVKFLSDKNYCFDVKETKCIRIKYFDFEKVRIKGLPDVNKLKEKSNLLAWECNLDVDDILEKVSDGHSLMHRGYFVVQGIDEADLDRQCNYILKQFQVEEC